MSEDAKIAHLQEKIHEARRNQIVAYAVTFVVLLPSGFLIGFIGGFMGFPLASVQNISFVLGGVLLVIGLGIGSYYGSKKKELMEQLKRMAEFTPKQKEDRPS